MPQVAGVPVEYWKFMIRSILLILMESPVRWLEAVPCATVPRPAMRGPPVDQTFWSVESVLICLSSVLRRDITRLKSPAMFTAADLPV